MKVHQAICALILLKTYHPHRGYSHPTHAHTLFPPPVKCFTVIFRHTSPSRPPPKICSHQPTNSQTHKLAQQLNLQWAFIRLSISNIFIRATTISLIKYQVSELLTITSSMHRFVDVMFRTYCRGASVIMWQIYVHSSPNQRVRQCRECVNVECSLHHKHI